MNAAHCTGSCAQGRLPRRCATGTGPRVIPTRPTLLQRLRRAWHRWDCATRLRRAWHRWDFATRLAGLEALEDELREHLNDLRSVQLQGSAAAAALARENMVRIGEQLDDTRAQALRLRVALAMLDEGWLP